DFVVHGLWPQFERGFPADCSGPPYDRRQVPVGLLDIMPSEPLIRHEWNKHGTCSGMNEKEYFEMGERAFHKVVIPAVYRQPLQQIQVAPRQIKENFARSNPSFPPGAFSVQCSGNRFLSEVRVCLTKDLQPRTCGAGTRDTCRSGEVI